MTQKRKNDKKKLTLPIESENESSSSSLSDNDLPPPKKPLGYRKEDEKDEPLETEERGLLVDTPVEYDTDRIDASPINVRVKFPRPGTKTTFDK